MLMHSGAFLLHSCWVHMSQLIDSFSTDSDHMIVTPAPPIAHASKKINHKIGHRTIFVRLSKELWAKSIQKCAGKYREHTQDSAILDSQPFLYRVTWLQ